ncbi:MULTISPECIES: BON domain-containing protein [unclassified Streptomyces]|uniref:BON domain-containing protein n=1 Tax=unclassified Streptomyces TaxID=2593676 RepID=UPI001BE8D132|nr:MULTISPECIES: BON domain-containing protein [unclassified Streptomyces]MBT2407616.1 BON domain-containing protein [Streptomyces sp. ISL-21]MBT2459076.1 BON domain-containing protein [Streptomyces sp. ISL-86]MBT2611610.1 BON domain-containing protein [Streptomyces sp. ISL-87]
MKEPVEYRIEHLRQRLAEADIAELGIYVDLRGDTVVLTGTVATHQCRETVRDIAESVLAGLPVLTDVVVGHNDPPEYPEDLS